MVQSIRNAKPKSCDPGTEKIATAQNFTKASILEAAMYPVLFGGAE
jgi:hypothetical protein